MPVSFTIMPELNLVHIVYSGAVTITELEDEFTRCYQHADYRAGMAEVSDLSQVTAVNIGFDEMHSYAKRSFEEHTVRAVPVTLCIVGGSDVTDPAVAMYEGLAAATNIPITMHEAQGYPEVLALLNLPPESLSRFPEFCRTESHLI